MKIKESLYPINENDEMFVEFKNTSGGTLNHGDLVVRDSAETEGNCMTTTTVQGHSRIEGVVFDPKGDGVVDDAAGLLLVKGFGSVKVGTGAFTVTGAAKPLCHSTSVKTAEYFTTSVVTLVAAGNALSTAYSFGLPSVFGWIKTSTDSASTSLAPSYLDFTN